MHSDDGNVSEFAEDELVTVQTFDEKGQQLHLMERCHVVDFLMSLTRAGAQPISIRPASGYDIEWATARRLGRTVGEHRAMEAARARTYAARRSEVPF